MSSAPYDTKNDEDFEATTRLLNEALRRIEKDLDLPTSVAGLAKEAGVHRNTIYNRKWPLEKLKAIKGRRVEQRAEQARITAESISPEQRLEKSRLEIIYWFTQLQQERHSLAELQKTHKETANSRDFYKSRQEQNLEVINALRNDIAKLQHTISVLEEELSLLKGSSDG